MTAVWSAQTGTSPVFSDGDALLAFFQTVATQLDFLQAQIQLVLALARAQTATGGDLDTWMAQFNFTRLPATFATGPENFLRATSAGSPIVVPLGTIVQTVGGGLQYQVVADGGVTSYDPNAGGYVLTVGATVVTATVEALVGGSAGNVLAGTVTQFGSSAPGINTVTNPAPITNGVDAETDASFRARFILYLATLAKATRSAILAAASSVQQGLLIALLENQQPGGTPLLGSFTTIVDDGSGFPPAGLISAVYNAVDAVRAFSVQPFVVAPTTTQATIAIAVRLVDPTASSTVNPAVQNAIAAMCNLLGPGVPLYASAIISTALGVSGVASVNAAGLTINGAGTDLLPTIAQEIRTSAAGVSVSNY